MNSPLKYLIATLKAAIFSESINTYYQNTKKEAVVSWLIPFIATIYVSLYFGRYLIGIQHVEDYTWVAYIVSFIIVSMLAIPKFLIFFGLVWQLCLLFKQTEYFFAFMAANNWFYLVYMVLYGLTVFAGVHGIHSAPRIFPIIIIFYLFLVVFFMAHNILRLQSDIAWLVPVTFIATDAIQRMILSKSGMLAVF